MAPRQTDDEVNTLTPGVTYDVASLVLVGWTEGDGTGHEGYALAYYFDAAGRYLGPDGHGIEPCIERTDADHGEIA
jgi:hypothetical protein